MSTSSWLLTLVAVAARDVDVRVVVGGVRFGRPWPTRIVAGAAALGMPC